jgi:aminoglycoside 6'-N-acetyltransferase
VSGELQGKRVTLRPLREDDLPRLVELGHAPEIARWWPDIEEPYLRRKLERGTAFAIEEGGELAGLAQWWENDAPDFRHAGIDLFLAPERHGRGLGRDAVRTLARWLVVERGHHRITIDPALANERAIRCYEAVGFRLVGVLRRYWHGPDGQWHDGLLLDLLANELDWT